MLKKKEVDFANSSLGMQSATCQKSIQFNPQLFDAAPSYVAAVQPCDFVAAIY